MLLTANLKMFHWNERLNWWLPGCTYKINSWGNPDIITQDIANLFPC